MVYGLEATPSNNTILKGSLSPSQYYVALQIQHYPLHEYTMSSLIKQMTKDLVVSEPTIRRTLTKLRNRKLIACGDNVENLIEK